MKTAELLIGTYTTGRSAAGLYWCTLDSRGRIEPAHCLSLRDPSFILPHPRCALAYAVEETPEDPGGLVTVGIDRRRRETVLMERVSSQGHLPCHVAASHGGNRLWVANYGSGTIAVFRVDGDGRLQGDAEIIRHTGRSSHPRRQSAPHPHCIAVHPNGHHVHIADLGTDRIERYALASDGAVTHLGGRALPAGTGPRHLCFDRAGRLAFLSTELDNTLTVLRVADDADLIVATRSSTLPPGVTHRSATSEVALHPNGRFIYVANRGHDSIACFALDPAGGATLTAWVASGGAHPRHFALSPSGDALIVANRDADRLVAFVVDVESGIPHSPVESTLPAPACVCWLR